MTPFGRTGDRNKSKVAEETLVLPEADRPSPPLGARNVVVVTLDSLRYDSAMVADMANMARLGDIERRFSYASWTAPSHFNMLMGLMPHSSPTHVYASEYYKADFARYPERFGIPGIDFAAMLPSLWLPTYVRNVLGYRTGAMVSMPVLNEHTPINNNFDTYRLMPTHNDFEAQLDALHFEDDVPTFWMLNVGETHYPYALADEDAGEWPRISGVHGVLKHLGSTSDTGEFFDADQMDRLRERQVRAARYCDNLLGKLYDIVPPKTWIIVTSDHGELFGEAGYFGHGPINHEKVHEVPFVEGTIR